MKTKNIIIIAILICLFAFVVTHTGFAHGDGNHTHPENEIGIDTATLWLKLTDAKKYSVSWQTAAKVFKSAVTADQWAKAAASARDPLGDLVSRDLFHDQLTTTLPGMPDGLYLVLRYATRFANKAHAVESITVMKDPDGTWRVAGYFIK